MLALWSAEAKLPPLLKLTLQHSKARLPSPAQWERGSADEGNKTPAPPADNNPNNVPLLAHPTAK